MMHDGQQHGTSQNTNAARRAVCSGARVVVLCALAVGVSGLLHAAVTLSPTSLTALSQDHAQGYLGIEFHDATNDQVVALHLPAKHGVEVLMVDHDGPAGQAGLQPHDIVIRVDNSEIAHADDLRKRIRDGEPGSVVTLVVMRQGRVLTLTANLANREELERKAWLDHMTVPAPSPQEAQVPIVIDQYNGPANDPSPSRSAAHGQSFLGSVLHLAPYTGVELQTMEPQLAGFFGAPPHTGLLVHAVEDNSPGAAAGLRAGDVVLKVNSAKVKSTSDWMKQVRAAKGGPVVLSILREKHEQTILLTPEAKKHSSLVWPRNMPDYRANA